jgi:non-specific protein-tyrosine kinase
MDIRRILTILKRWLWLLVLGAVVAGGAGYLISARQTPMYQASTRFVVLRAATTGYDYYAFLDYQQLLSTYTQLLSTDKLLAQVSQEVGFPVYAGQANAQQIEETQFIRLTVTHQDPVKAATIANTLVNVLISQNEELQSVRYETSIQNMQNRANQALSQMEVLENQIENLSVTTLEEQITEVQKQVEDLQSQVTDLEFNISSIDPLFATEEEVIQRLQFQAELDQIKPLLELYQEIYTQLVVMGEPMQSENSSATQMARLERTLDLYEQIYFTSLSALENINLTQAQSTPNVVQVEPATVPRAPISPRPMQTSGLYGAVGLLLTGGVAFLVEYLDDTIKTPDEVKDVLGLPVIGLVGDMEDGGIKNKGRESNIFVAQHPRSPISEAFRSLRTSLEFYSVDSPLEILIITSSGPEEGKTTVASNLSVILASGNKKVLLLDADLRRPNIHKLFGVSNRVGLSDLLRGKLDYADVIQTFDDIENLSIITSGSLPPNPAELIASKKMNSIIDDLKTQYDMLIIDTPPAIVTDSQILASKADGVIYVLRPGKTRSVTAQTPLEEFHRVGANMIGVVMNRIPRNRGYYYGGYEYYAPGTQFSEKYYRFESDHGDLMTTNKRDDNKTLVEGEQRKPKDAAYDEL